MFFTFYITPSVGQSNERSYILRRSNKVKGTGVTNNDGKCCGDANVDSHVSESLKRALF